MITSLAERLEQKGYNRALELVKRAEERAEAEKQRAEAEKQRAEAEKQRAEAEKQRATHKARLKTAVSMRKKGLDLLLIADISEIQQEYLEKLFRKIGI
ncbi:MAG: hypothetical protein H7A25_19570 [Leptospiraceae bacterium]|nr:hypothetical protein [Leptospiraceae bacterium]